LGLEHQECSFGARYGDDARSREWHYPTDVERFLRAIGTSRDDPTTVRMAVEIIFIGLV
jgi:hypothetical protein